MAGYREIPGDTRRYQRGRYEIRADTGRRDAGDTGRCEEMQGDTGRYGHIGEMHQDTAKNRPHQGLAGGAPEADDLITGVHDGYRG